MLSQVHPCRLRGGICWEPLGWAQTLFDLSLLDPVRAPGEIYRKVPR